MRLVAIYKKEVKDCKGTVVEKPVEIVKPYLELDCEAKREDILEKHRDALDAAEVKYREVMVVFVPFSVLE